MKKLLIMFICGLMIITCACGKKSNKDTEIGESVKEGAQENEISQEEQEETINNWNEALGVTAEDDKSAEDKVDGTSPNSDNSTTNPTSNPTTNPITDNSSNGGNADGGTGSDDTEDATETDEKEEGEDEKEDDSDAWTKDY